jgi:hypothetical protein
MKRDRFYLAADRHKNKLQLFLLNRIAKWSNIAKINGFLSAGWASEW